MYHKWEHRTCTCSRSDRLHLTLPTLYCVSHGLSFLDNWMTWHFGTEIALDKYLFFQFQVKDFWSYWFIYQADICRHESVHLMAHRIFERCQNFRHIWSGFWQFVQEVWVVIVWTTCSGPHVLCMWRHIIFGSEKIVAPNNCFRSLGYHGEAWCKIRWTKETSDWMWCVIISDMCSNSFRASRQCTGWRK